MQCSFEETVTFPDGRYRHSKCINKAERRMNKMLLQTPNEVKLAQRIQELQAEFEDAAKIAETAEDRVFELQTENKKLKDLLKRHKETMEPFPIVSDLKSMTQVLREKHGKEDVATITKLFNERQKQFRVLYKDTEQALKDSK